MMFSFLFAVSTVVAAPVEPIQEPVAPLVEEPSDTPVKESPKKIEPFTGMVTGTKVRMRLQPSLDSLILKELTHGDLLIITGETEDFYAVMPEKSMKGYIYRAYVLDNIVEANNVNLRLDADLQSPIITQLSQGSKVQGTVSHKNNKWLAVDLPEDVRFYIAKNYIKDVGNVSFYTRAQAKREHAKTRLSDLEAAITAELQKPFPDICLAENVNELKLLAEQNKDLPEYSEKALALVKSTEEQYLQLSQAYQIKHKAIAEAPQEKPVETTPAQTTPQPQPSSTARPSVSFPLEQQEAKLIAQAMEAGNAPTKEAFYANEKRGAEELYGQLIPYSRAVKNRPGDFIIVDPKTKVPLAYLYSTRIDLGPYAGQTVNLVVTKRSNHNFALPAYFVLEVQVVEPK